MVELIFQFTLNVNNHTKKVNANQIITLIKSGRSSSLVGYALGMGEIVGSNPTRSTLTNQVTVIVETVIGASGFMSRKLSQMKVSILYVPLVCGVQESAAVSVWLLTSEPVA